jgi:hypothetical protein
MPKCTIDGKEIEVKPGTTVLQAAIDNGIHLQYFCWHPDLPVDGNCRTCMIEVEKMPKLQIACNTVVSEGMVVHTKSAKAHEAQRTALEFLLVNHPIDCPVCDQAGECYLQDNYMRYGLYDSKIELEEKVHKRKGGGPRPIMLGRRALRAVLALPALRGQGHRDQLAPVRESRRPHADRDLRRPQDRARVRRQPGRRLPGGSALVDRLPLQDAGLVPEGARVGLPRCSTGCNSTSTSATAACSGCARAATRK